MSARAKITLGAAIIISSLTVWGVHFQQTQEREAMNLRNLSESASYMSAFRLSGNQAKFLVPHNALAPCSFGF
ncbi:cytochrome c oxidase assembly protein [Lentinula edodes]|uniref:Cytochrome c oxidase assembly protein n=1 Tax=Lentinula edodes TaxID=5353 RepID=A0A1Q3E0F9_LENED|nr:cytochrome c oxidase assembly protein [Lentinula edodes]